MSSEQENDLIMIATADSEKRLTPTPLTLIPYQGITQRTQWAIQIMGSIERYGLERLIEEVERQARLMAEKGGISDATKLYIALVMAECVTQLRAINTQTNDQLLEILNREV